jgi:hypothetical protein
MRALRALRALRCAALQHAQDAMDLAVQMKERDGTEALRIAGLREQGSQVEIEPERKDFSVQTSFRPPAATLRQHNGSQCFPAYSSSARQSWGGGGGGGGGGDGGSNNNHSNHEGMGGGGSMRSAAKARALAKAMGPSVFGRPACYRYPSSLADVRPPTNRLMAHQVGAWRECRE